MDIAEDIFDAAIYVNGVYRGDNVKLIPEMPRGRNLLEIRSGILSSSISTVVEISETKPLVVLKLTVIQERLKVEEIDPRGHLR